MIGKAKEYIIGMNGVVHAPLEVVGGEAKELGELAGTGIQVPYAFILTSSAFDDFVTAAEL